MTEAQGQKTEEQLVEEFSRPFRTPNFTRDMDDAEKKWAAFLEFCEEPYPITRQLGRHPYTYSYWSDIYWATRPLFCAEHLPDKVTEEEVTFATLLVDALKTGTCIFINETEKTALIYPHPYLKTDEDDEFHCEDGPSVEFLDGEKWYHWHGVQVPEKCIMRPQELTIEEVREEENADVRAILLERFGISRYMLECGAKMISLDDSNPENQDGRSITRVLIEDEWNGRWMVATDGSTDTVYTIRVSDENETPAEAMVSLFPTLDGAMPSMEG